MKINTVKKIAVLGIGVVVAIAVILYLINVFYVPVGSYMNESQNGTRILFSTSLYSMSSIYTVVLVANPPTNATAPKLTDYKINYTRETNGSVEVNIVWVETNETRTVILQPGYKLYHIDLARADDLYGEETTITDDRFVIVDPSGYISSIFT